MNRLWISAGVKIRKHLRTPCQKFISIMAFVMKLPDQRAPPDCDVKKLCPTK
jgi:hypothetical protein